MTQETTTPDGFEVVAICTDNTVTEPFGTYADITSAVKRKKELEHDGGTLRQVDRFEVHRIRDSWYSCPQCDWSGERCPRDDHYPVCPDCLSIVDVHR